MIEDRWLPGIMLPVDPIAGSSIDREIIPSMGSLAKRMGIAVCANLNGVFTIIYPADRVSDVAANWTEAARLGQNFASADQPVKGPTQ